MDWINQLAPFSLLDAISVAAIVVAYIGMSWLIEHPPARRPSVTVLMTEYRRDWMRQFVTRQPRIFDATMIESLRQGTAFFASTCMIAIGGGAAVISNPSRLADVAADLTPDAVTDAIELRVILVLLFLSNSLLKFIWANRLFGYCSILMAAVPNDPDDPLAYHRAAQAAELNITAARSFNRGLQSVYFALAALAWLLGPIALLGATVLTVLMLVRREFASSSRAVVLRRDP